MEGAGTEVKGYIYRERAAEGMSVFVRA